MSAVTHMVLFGIKKALTLTQVSQGAGTAVGDMTNNGGLAAAFDGTTSQATAACAVKTAAAGGTFYIGKNWGVPKLLGKIVIWGSSDNGFGASGVGNTINIAIRGSNDGSSWTSLFSTSFTDSNGLSKTYTDPTDAINISTAYSYHSITLQQSIYDPKVAELQFWEYI